MIRKMLLVGFVLVCILSVKAFAEDKLPAKAVVLIEMETGRVLFEQNAHGKLPMASTTKIMTSLIALEQPNLDEYFTVDSEAIRVEGSSMGLMANDSVSLRALVSGMMVPSGNDAANATAIRISGSQEKFAELMNKRAKELGLENTSFVTPSGLDADNHYSTAYDMAKLTMIAMGNPDFAQICSEYRAKVKFGNPPFERWLLNYNKLLEIYEHCVGVKTGLTDAAGRCLVTAAKRDDIGLICVTLNASDDFNMHKNLYEKYFSGLKREKIDIPDIYFPVTGSYKSKIRAVCETPEKALLFEEIERLEYSVSGGQFLYSPIKKNEVIGKVAISLDGILLAELDLLSDEEAMALDMDKGKDLWSMIKEWWKGLYDDVNKS